MKKILCYGDSNVFGFNPKNGNRFNENNRWSGILKKVLKEYFEIIEEGLNNRTAFSDNPAGIEYCALKHLPQILEKINNIEFIILAIGTNDLQFNYNIDDLTFEKKLKNLIQLIEEKNIKTILIPPVVLNERILNSYFSTLFNENSIKKSKNISNIYRKAANQNNCYYFDINEFTEPSIDGLHYDETSHNLIAEKLNTFIKEII